jgi:hypothetical protein
MIDCFFEIIAAAGPFFIFSQMGEGKDTGKLLFKSLTSSNSSVQFDEDETGITFSSNAGNATVPGIEIDEIAWGTGTGTGITSSTIIAFPFTQQKSRALKVDKRENYESIIGVGIWSPKTNCDNLQQSARCRNHMIIGGSKNSTSNGSESCNNVILSGICNTIQGWSLLSGVGPKFGCHDVIVAGRENFIYSSQNSVIIGGCKNSFYDVSNTLNYECNGGYNSTIIGSQKIELCRSVHNTAIISSSNLTFSSTSGIFNYFDTSSVVSSVNFCDADLFVAFLTPDLSSFLQKTCLNQLISTTDVLVNSDNNSIIASSQLGIIGTVSGIQSAKNNSILSSHQSFLLGSSGNFLLSSMCSQVRNGVFSSAPLKAVNANNIIMGSYFSVISSEGDTSSCKLQNSAIISGYCNRILQLEADFRSSVEQSVIIGGDKNTISSSCNSLITNSISATISRDASSIISTSNKSVICGNNGSGVTGYDKSRNNSILTSVDSIITCSQNSSIISSINSTASGIKNAIINSSRNSTIIGNRCAPAYVSPPFCHQHSNMISSNYNSNIRFTTANFFGGNNFMMSGSYNNILVNGNSNFNLIISGASNSICRTSDSVILAGALNCISTDSSSYGVNVIVGGCCNKILGKPKFSSIIGGKYNLIQGDSTQIGISIVGGCQICNKYAYTTMVPKLCLNPDNSALSNIWMCGFTGSTGTWSSTGASIRVCNGLVVCIT